MRVADLATANQIVERLAKIAAIKNGKRDESLRPQFLIAKGNTTEWVSLSKTGADAAWRALMAELDAEAADLRRRAAQINFSLEPVA